MALNIFIFLFIGALWGLLYYFPLRRAKTPNELKALCYFLLVFGVVFLGNACGAALGARSLWRAVRTPVVMSLGTWGELSPGQAVILSGRVSLANPLLLSNYVAYDACDAERCDLGEVPEHIRLTLDDGDVVIRNNDFQAVAWPLANNPPESFYIVHYLAPGEPVIVAGLKESCDTVKADLLYVGTHRAFVARAKRNLLMPLMLLGLNLLGAISIVVLPLQRWRTLQRQSADTKPKSDPFKSI